MALESILVTGVAGFIGSNFIRLLVKERPGQRGGVATNPIRSEPTQNIPKVCAM